MSDKDLTRRDVIKGITASAAATTVGVGSATADSVEKEEFDSNEEYIETIDNEYAKEILETAGNPEITSLTKTTYDLSNKSVEDAEHSPDELNNFELETSTGELVYNEFKVKSEDEKNNAEKKSGIYYKYKDTDEIDAQLPEELQAAPKESTLLILKDQDDDVVRRRTLTEQENRRVIKYLNEKSGEKYPQTGDAVGVYCEKLGGIYFSLVNEEEGYTIATDNPKSNLDSDDDLLTTSVGDDLLESNEDPIEVYPTSDCDGLIFHPCTECAATSAGCAAGCAGVCVGTAGVACAACILAACPYAVNSCCICLTCIDDFDWDDNPDLRRTCPEDIIP